MREVKDTPGPGHDGSGGVVVPPFYAQQKQQQQQLPQHHPGLGPHHTLAHPQAPLPHPHQTRPAAPAHQQPGMRGSPAPPTTAGNNPPHQQPHSPHVSSAVGPPGGVVMSPHPSSGQSEGSNSRMHAPGYPPNASHMSGGPPGPHGYPSKMGHMAPGPSGPGFAQPGFQHGPGHQYTSQRPPSHMMQGYAQGYPPGGPQGPQGPPTSMPPGHQYSPRPPHNSHVPPNQAYGYPHFSQPGWGQGPPGSGMPGGPSMMGTGPAMPGKAPNQMPGQTSQPGTNSVGGPRSHTPPHYLKPQMQHKIGAYPPPPPGHQMYPNGPGIPPGLMNSRENSQNSMPPPTSSSQPLSSSSSTVDGEQHPGAAVNSTSNSALSNLANSVSNSNMNSNNPPQIGPDGNPVVDEGSQQSTVSNTSAASGDDRSCTPKPHKEGMTMGLSMSGTVGTVVPPSMIVAQHPSSLPPTPKNSAPSPGTGSMPTQMDESENLNSPSWPRSPSGPPVYVNNQPPPPPEIYRTTKAGDSLMRLYEMSDSPERKAWLDKLLHFMEDNKTPITTCPTISKNPLDLYALYLHVRERGGFEEITKNKQWKDIAAVMGIGASSSGSYTLRKHYMKHILSYECKFDRGGIDPQPIINQIESTQKKKSSKSLSVPSPGSNNSSMDGFTNGPHMPGGPGMGSPYPQYPPSSEFSGHMPQRPGGNQPTSGYQGMPGGGQYSGYQVMHGPYGSGGYPNPDFNPNRNYQQPGPQNTANYSGYQQPPGYPRPGYPPTQQPYPPDQYSMGTSPAPNNYGSSQLAKQLLNPTRTAGPVHQPFQNSNMYPQKPGASPSPGPPQPPTANQAAYQPRRHPDFDKAQGWRPPNSQFPGFGGQPTPGPPQQPWVRASEPGPTAGPQWNQPRFPPQPSPNFTNQPRWSSNSFTPGAGGLRTQSPTPGSKNFPLSQATSFKSTGYGTYMGKQLFPMDSVEAVSPVLVKRKRMGRSDLQPVDPWRLLMSLRCGLSSEVTWALDILNILLFDDQSVVFFGLHHMPGLLESLIEHLRRGLINMFNICSELELGRDDEATGANKRIKAELHDCDHPWYLAPPPSPSLDLDLGKPEDNPDSSDKDIFLKGPDYTYNTRTGKTVRILNPETKLFMKEGTREWDKWEGYDSGVDTWSVGGGECTAHIICSMQSAVPPLPFTRLIAKIAKSVSSESASVDNVNSDNKVDVSAGNEIVIKVETVEVDAQDKTDTKFSLDKTANESEPKQPEPSPPKEICETKLKTTTSEKCNGPKDGNGPISKPTLNPKFGRKNNAKSLDAILKRIKKEPVHSSGLSIFNKFNDPSMVEKDSKSVLDLYLKKNEASEESCSENIQKDSLPITDPCQTEEKPISLKPPEEEPTPVHRSPMKLPSLSPIKISEKISSDRCSTGSRRESAGFKRTYEDLEEESWNPDEASLSTTTEGQDWLARRVITVGTAIRNLSFIPGNEDLMGKSASLLALLGKTILLHHTHPSRSPSTTHYDRDEETDFSDWCSSLAPDTYWWWPYLHHVHENALVTLANMAGHLDLSYYPEEISRPILNGLLHWATCPASYGQDPLPGGGISPLSSLSPQRLALEALVKLCVLDPNTDLVLATPPFSRLDMLCSQLTRLLCRGEDQVLREFSINLFHYFSAADSGVARVIAMQNGCVSLLAAFIEEAESNALSVANVQGVSALKENPELMGTSLDMVRRAANTLVNLSRVPDNYRVISACENRLLTLVMSQILDTYVASQLSQVLFNVAQAKGENTIVSSSSSHNLSIETISKDMSFYPLLSKELEKTMDCLGSIGNKVTEVKQVSEEEEQPALKQTKSSEKYLDDKSESDEEKQSTMVISESQESTSATAGKLVSPSVNMMQDTISATASSTPSKPASLASHPSASQRPIATSFAETTLNTHHALKCNTASVEAKAAPTVTPTL